MGDACMNFAALTFVDTAQCTASFVTKFKSQVVRAEGDFGKIPLWADGAALPILDEWKSARTVLSMIRSATAPLLDGKPAALNSADIYLLNPRQRIDWREGESDGLWAWLPLLPSPSVMLFSGIEAHNPPVGQLTAVNRTQPFAAINIGIVKAVWLVIDARKPE
jgi:hypothetical protein